MRALQIEYIKLFRPSTYIIVGIVLVGYLLWTITALQFSGPMDKEMVMKALDASQIDSSFTFVLLGLFFIMNIGKEYSENTLRRSVIEGYTRSQFFIGKILLVFTASLALLTLQKLVFFISAAASGQLHEALGAMSLSGILISVFKMLFNAVLAVFLIFVTRSIAFSMLLYIFWGLGEAAIRLYLKFKFPEADYGLYLPVNSIGQLLASDGTVAYNYLLLACSYLAAMIVVAYGLLLNRDIK